MEDECKERIVSLFESKMTVDESVPHTQPGAVSRSHRIPPGAQYCGASRVADSGYTA